MTAPNRNPTTIWSLRRDPNEAGYVRTGPGDTIEYVVPYDGDEAFVQVMRVTRKNARLLAKRLNECLDATVKR